MSTPRVRLWCFPHAGGAAWAFSALRAAVPPAVQLSTVAYPGRGTRRKEPLARSMHELVDDALGQIGPSTDECPTVFVGHSLGALVAFETARELQRRRAVGSGAQTPAPDLLIVSGREAPHREVFWRPIHDQPDSTLLARLVELGGMPREITASSDLAQTFLPAIRADLHIAETYRPEGTEPISVPITAIFGTADPLLRAAGVGEWDCWTTGSSRVHTLDASHDLTGSADYHRLIADESLTLAVAFGH